jgi:uncharacterized protein YndB with AHSA1/START domain
MNTTKSVSLAIKAEPDAVWTALTDGSISPAYYYGFSIESDFERGSEYVYTAGGMPMITGTVAEISPGKSVTMTFNGAWDPAVAALPESTVTYSLDAPAMPIPGVTVLNLKHEGMPEGETADNVQHGWVLILSGLKTLVETGAPLAAAPGA